MKYFLLRCLYYLQVHRLMRYLWRKKVIILTYHGFTNQKNHEGIENYQGKHLFIERFKSQLEYLKKYHRVISLEKWLTGRVNGEKAPEGAVIITFDDGYQSNYTLAFPLLKAEVIPATIFLTTQFIESKELLWTDRVEYLIGRSEPDCFELKTEEDANGGFSLPIEFHDRNSRITCEKKIRGRFKIIPQENSPKVLEKLEERLGWKLAQDPNPPEIYRALEWFQIQEMVQSGLVSVGSHTHTHVILTRCRTEEAEKELSLSREIIEKRTGLRCQLFCYPNGEAGDFNQETKKQLQESGYLCALTSVFGVNDGETDPFELKRIGASSQGDLIEFVMNLYGVTQLLSDLKQFLLKLFLKKEPGKI